MSFTIPAGSVVTIGLTPPILKGVYVWSVSGGSGTLTANSDGLSAVYKAAGVSGTDTIDVANYQGNPWRPKTLYRVGDTIIDSNRNLQTVTAGTRTLVVPDAFTSDVTVGEPNTHGFLGGDDATSGVKRDLNISRDYPGSAPAAPSTTGTFTTGGFSGTGLANTSEGGGVDDVWSPNTVYVLGQKIVDSRGNIQKVTTAGKSGAGTIASISPTPAINDPALYRHARTIIKEPNWSTSSTTSDGGVTWTFQGSANQLKWATSGTTVDGELTWTKGSISNSDTWDSIQITTGASGVVPAGNYFLLPLE